MFFIRPVSVHFPSATEYIRSDGCSKRGTFLYVYLIVVVIQSVMDDLRERQLEKLNENHRRH